MAYYWIVGTKVRVKWASWAAEMEITGSSTNVVTTVRASFEGVSEIDMGIFDGCMTRKYHPSYSKSNFFELTASISRNMSPYPWPQQKVKSQSWIHWVPDRQSVQPDSWTSKEYCLHSSQGFPVSVWDRGGGLRKQWLEGKVRSVDDGEKKRRTTDSDTSRYPSRSILSSRDKNAKEAGGRHWPWCRAKVIHTC